MNVTQQGIITLLKSAVTGQAYPLPAEFDLASAFRCINKHQMTALAYEGAVLCGVDQKLPAMQDLFHMYCRMLQISERQMAHFHSICRAFDEAEIDYMPLKGCRMKALYRKPELRTMGDVDILIRVSQYDKIRQIMEKLGFQEFGESDHELIWEAPGLQVELHKRLVPSYNKDYYTYYGEGWQLAKVKDGTCYAMTREDQMVYLLTHFAKHFRDGGIGCRHVVDLWVFRQANPGLDEQHIEAELDKLQLTQFYRNTRRLIGCWFADGAEDATLAFMTEYIFASGSWGQLESRAVSKTLRESTDSPLKFSGKLVYLIHLMFPPVQVLERKYTVLQKLPWLLPIVWLIRPFYKALFDRNNLDNRKREYNAVNQKALHQRQEMLNSVGLDYNF